MAREKVQISTALHEALQDEGYLAHDIEEFVQTFADWKSEGAEGEFAYYWFGKDGGYSRPQRNGRTVLWHVHLPPELNKEDIEEWERLWGRQSRKSSDTALIYTHDAQHGYLLLYIAREPHAHDLCDMRTQESFRLMQQLADAAEAFILRGVVAI